MGKSFVTAAMAIVLARMGRNVIAVDASLGSPGLHTFLGSTPAGRTLLDVLEEKEPLEAALRSTSEPGLSLLSCTGDFLGASEVPAAAQRQILQLVSNLPADHILMDLGAGFSLPVLDIFNAGERAIVAVCADPASIQSAYSFLRNALIRRLQHALEAPGDVGRKLWRQQWANGGRQLSMPEILSHLSGGDTEATRQLAATAEAFRPWFALNMVRSEQDGRTAAIFRSAVKQYLGVELDFAGEIAADASVRAAAQRLTEMDFDDPDCAIAVQVRGMVNRILDRRIADRADPGAPAQGYNDNLEFFGRNLHIQTEDLGGNKRCIATQVFLNGRVIFSTKSDYPAAAGSALKREGIAARMRQQHMMIRGEIESQKARLAVP